jgi:phospholipid/cholesterol/gamma-HCH transport system permease protein
MVEQGKELLQLICTKLGAAVLYVCALCGQLVILLQAALRQLPKVNWGEALRQMSLLGADSLPIVLMTILFTGMVFSVQTSKEFVRFGASASAGGVVAIAMGRELVPVLVGVVVAGRIGAAIAAEIGTMKVTEQIDASACYGYRPYQVFGYTKTRSTGAHDACAGGFCQCHR